MSNDLPSYYRGIRASIAWLHARALEMNDPHARAILNTAAFNLGVAKPDAAFAPASPADQSALPRDAIETKETTERPSRSAVPGEPGLGGDGRHD